MFLYETVLAYPGKMDTRMSQKSNVEVQHNNWKLNLSTDNDPSDPDNPGPSLLINPMGVGGVGL